MKSLNNIFKKKKKMKRLIVVIPLFILAIVSTQSLQAQASIRGGVNIASMSANATEKSYKDYENQSIFGFQLAVAMPFKISNNIAIQPELVFIQKGGKSQYVTDEKNKYISTFTSNYIEVPVSLKLALGNTSGGGIGFYILGGPYAGIVLNGKYKNELTFLGVNSTSEKTVDYTDDGNAEKRIDWGFNLGAGLSLGKMYFEGRYGLGINNLLDDNATNSSPEEPYRRNRGIGLSVGVYF
jgi:Outer membrane protein beta-barrel domain